MVFHILIAKPTTENIKLSICPYWRPNWGHGGSIGKLHITNWYYILLHYMLKCSIPLKNLIPSCPLHSKWQVQPKIKEWALIHLLDISSAFQNGMSYLSGTNVHRKDALLMHVLIRGKAKGVRPQAHFMKFWQILKKLTHFEYPPM